MPGADAGAGALDYPRDAQRSHRCFGVYLVDIIGLDFGVIVGIIFPSHGERSSRNGRGRDQERDAEPALPNTSLRMLRRYLELDLHIAWFVSASSGLWRALAPCDDAVRHVGGAKCVEDAAVGHGDVVVMVGCCEVPATGRTTVARMRRRTCCEQSPRRSSPCTPTCTGTIARP